jgi:uncharacterized membrane protein YdbT with pleckstrin-like domain
MPTQHSPAGATLRAPQGTPDAKAPHGRAIGPDVERWRCPAVLRVKSVVVAAAGAAIAVVFFPPWFGIPVAGVLAAWGLGLAALGASVAVDRAAGTLALRMGLVVRRVRLADVTAVLVDQAKVSIGRANGGEVSMYAWRKSPLDALLRVPAVAGDIGHAIASAVALAKAGQDPDPEAAAEPEAAAAGARPASPGRSPARARSRLATALLGGAGALAIVGALVVRVHWHNPVLTVLSVILALALGVAGLLYLLVALWILLTGHSPRTIVR